MRNRLIKGQLAELIERGFIRVTIKTSPNGVYDRQIGTIIQK